MQTDTYKTILKEGEGLYKEKGSKFIAFSHHVVTPEEAKEIVDGYKKTYYDARHVCYAYNLRFSGGCFRANDDGEPSGTAGRPILGQINSFELTDTLVVVIRYFGGVLLGTGGLIQAYKLAAADTLTNSEIVEKTIDEIVTFCFEFPFLNDVMKIVKNTGACIVNQSFEMDCKMTLSIRRNNYEKLNNLLVKVDTLRFDDCN